MGKEQQIIERLEQLHKDLVLASKPVLSITEAAEFTGFSISYLYQLTSQKLIPHYKKSRKVFFRKSELEEWLTEERVRTEEEEERAAENYMVEK